MRLEPIEKPKSLFLKIAYWFSRKQFGKVLTPLKVIYSRKPELLRFSMKIIKFEEKQNSLSPDLRLFIKIATATQNGCSFCQDIALAQAIKGKIGTEKFVALIENNQAKGSVFTEKEKIVLSFIKEYDKQRRVSEETFEKLKKYFNETEIIEIIALNAFEQYYNAMSLPLEIHSDGLHQIAESKT